MQELIPDFFYHLYRINSFHEFWLFFNAQPLIIQAIMGLVIFGLLVLVYIFFVAIFIDKHI